MFCMRSRRWFFDCDGVLLDSNGVKTEAFRRVAMRYGPDVAADVVDHHLRTGGMSRFAKFDRLFREVLRREPKAGELEALLDDFAAASREGLLHSSTDPAAASLITSIRHRAEVHVVSGGAENEVSWALEQHGLAALFDGIHGSPRTKREILGALSASPLARPGVFIGDSRLDMEVAAESGLMRVFVSHWSEFSEWRAFVDEHRDVLVVHSLGELYGIVRGETDRTLSYEQRWVLSLR